MRDENSRKSKVSWSKKLVRKWFNIKSKNEDFQADDVVIGGSEVEWRKSCSEREPGTVKRSKTDKIGKKHERVRRGRIDLNNPRIVDVQNYSIFAATWNVGGKCPHSNLNLDDWLHVSPPADIYVLGFQEIVPLNAGNVLGAEDNGPAKRWLALIRKTLNNLPGDGGSNGCYMPSPVPEPVVEIDADFEESARQNGSSFFPRHSLQATRSWRMENERSPFQPHLDRRFSVCDQYISRHRPSDYDSNRRSANRPSDCDSSYRSGHRASDFDSSGRSNYRPSDYDSNHKWNHRRSDYDSNHKWNHRPSDYDSNQIWNHRPSDYSRWASSDDDNNGSWESPSTVLFSPMSYAGSGNNDGSGSSRYCLVVSKQMVGIFLTVWVRSDLRDHVRNMKVSCVGRGLMGYLGNKGSISVSMSLHRTSFCFVCTHLTSGQKEGDELRRNADVMEILKKTRFPRVNGDFDVKSPETILEHDRVLWLGDLNYRIALSYQSAKALVEMHNWKALLENDQLRIEQRRGHVFKGWNEGRIYFPPTYKYSFNSDRYSGSNMHPKEKRRTPAWCDRILWYGGGWHQLSYVRGESRFSDHRPVYSLLYAEVELVNTRFRKSVSSSRIEIEELLPYSHGYTELSFF